MNDGMLWGFDMLSMLKRLFGKSQPVTNREELLDFLDRHTSFVSQKCITEYCRSKAGVNWDKLMLEADFLNVVNVSRWQAYIHVMDDIVVMLEALLRPHCENRLEELANALVALESDVIKGHDIPIIPEGGWSEHLQALKGRIGFLQEGPPHATREIAKVSGDKVFNVLPIHSRLSHYDYELVVNSVRFLMMGVHGKILEQIDLKSAVNILIPPASQSSS
jgi:hypothetical protein